MAKLGFVKKLVVKAALGTARMFVTADYLKGEVREGLNYLASKAHAAGGENTADILNRSKTLCEVMADGKVDAEETDRLLGDIITDENVAKAFDYIEGKIG